MSVSVTMIPEPFRFTSDHLPPYNFKCNFAIDESGRVTLHEMNRVFTSIFTHYRRYQDSLVSPITPLGPPAVATPAIVSPLMHLSLKSVLLCGSSDVDSSTSDSGIPGGAGGAVTGLLRKNGNLPPPAPRTRPSSVRFPNILSVLERQLSRIWFHADVMLIVFSLNTLSDFEYIC